MKILKCANCGAPLNIQKPARAVPCQYCGGVNIIDSPESVFGEASLNETEEFIPRILEPIETFLITYYYKGEAINGKLLISDREVYLKPISALNLFDEDIAVYFKLQDVVGFKKGMLFFLTIFLNGGNSILISTYSKNGIINTINSQKEKLPQNEICSGEESEVVSPDGFEGEYEQVSGKNGFPILKFVLLGVIPSIPFLCLVVFYLYLKL